MRWTWSRTCERAGHHDPELLVAALLHDAAKGERMRLWHRVAGRADGGR